MAGLLRRGFARVLRRVSREIRGPVPQIKTPVNYQKHPRDMASLQAELEHVLEVFASYVTLLAPGALAGSRVLELGPGHSLGTSAMLACGGAEVWVADKYLAPWDTDYHGAFFRLLHDRVSADPALDPAPLARCLEAHGFVAMQLCHADAESIAGAVAPQSFDLVVSNAVLEHVSDMPAALRALAAVSKLEGRGLHQIDFRDHRNFDRPLEYLTMARASFDSMFIERRGECGNRHRHCDFLPAFEAAGFSIENFTPNVFAEPGYVEDVRPRLHSDFADLPRDALEILSGMVEVRKKA